MDVSCTGSHADLRRQRQSLIGDAMRQMARCLIHPLLVYDTSNEFDLRRQKRSLIGDAMRHMARCLIHPFLVYDTSNELGLLTLFLCMMYQAVRL